jgi:serine/threonine protein kinase
VGNVAVPPPTQAGLQSVTKSSAAVLSAPEVKPGPPTLPAKPQQSASPPASPSAGARGRGRPRFQSDAPRSQRLTEDEKKEKVEQTKAEMIRNLDAVWLLQYSDCFFEKQLGKGVSSTVYKGKHKDKEVALKVLRLENQQRDLDDFKKYVMVFIFVAVAFLTRIGCREIEVMTQLESPQVIKFFGATFDPKLCIVMEYCPNGALFQYMQDPTVVIDWNLVLRWSREAALGLLALHNFKPQIVHRDFKSLNLLLDGTLNIKVCDFGLSRFVQPEDEDKRSTLHTLRGTYAYAAPEVFHKEQYTTKSDVYSYGIVVWELIMKAMKGKYHRPYGEFPELVHDFQVLMQATKGVRPSIPANCPGVLAALVKACWAPRPEERPACADLIVLLEVLQKDYDAYKSKWNSALYSPADADPKSR